LFTYFNVFFRCVISEPPNFPRNLHITEQTSRSIVLSWASNADANVPITNYVLQFKESNGEREKESLASANIKQTRERAKKKCFSCLQTCGTSTTRSRSFLGIRPRRLSRDLSRPPCTSSASTQRTSSAPASPATFST